MFTEQHYDQCKRYQWSEVNIDFISPQQDLIAEAILSGLAVSSTCPESTPGFDVLSSEIPIPVVCILVTYVIMARPSEVCEYCPTVESIEIPTQRKDWCDDNMPKLS